jgi:hypothetical protein
MRKGLFAICLSLIVAIVLVAGLASTCVPTPLDAYMTFISWSINGTRVPPGTYTVKAGSNTTIDAEYEVYIAGNPREKVAVNETNLLQIHYIGPMESSRLHCVNGDGAVSMTPPATQKSQQTTVNGTPVNYCHMTELKKCVPVNLDFETTWEQNKGTKYTKKIDWVGFSSPSDILFDLPPAAGNYTLITWACVAVGGDVNPANDCSGNSTILLIEVTP